MARVADRPDLEARRLLLALSIVPPPRHTGPDTVAAIRRGAWAVRDPRGARAVLIATGSEVGLALGAADLLAADGVPVKVVSMPSTSVSTVSSGATVNSALMSGPRQMRVTSRGHSA